jgi:hypothetical protein
MGSAIVVADTSVIINFLRIDRMDLIGSHPSPFIVTDHVADEIADSYPEQQARFHAALGSGHITQHRIDDPAEMEAIRQGAKPNGPVGRLRMSASGGRAVMAQGRPAAAHASSRRRPGRWRRR